MRRCILSCLNCESVSDRAPALTDIKLKKLSSLFTPNSVLMSLTTSHPADESLSAHPVFIRLFILHDYIPAFHQTPEPNAPLNPAAVFHFCSHLVGTIMCRKSILNRWVFLRQHAAGEYGQIINLVIILSYVISYHHFLQDSWLHLDFFVFQKIMQNHVNNYCSIKYVLICTYY